MKPLSSRTRDLRVPANLLFHYHATSCAVLAWTAVLGALALTSLFFPFPRLRISHVFLVFISLSHWVHSVVGQRSGLSACLGPVFFALFSCRMSHQLAQQYTLML